MPQPIRSIRYLMAVMDEETRPLVTKVFQRLQEDVRALIDSAILHEEQTQIRLLNEDSSSAAEPWIAESLLYADVYENRQQNHEVEFDDDGGAIMVLFRLNPGDDPANLLEASLGSMTNGQHNQWSYISISDSKDPQEQDGPWQTMVNNMAESLQNGRTPVEILRQGKAKIKAPDTMKWCVGILSNGGTPTHISTIIHQTFNMGLNGDLMINEAHCIFNALAKNNVLAKNPIDPNPSEMCSLDFMSYGAGGAANHDTNPGDLVVSDGVIDLRTHVDPRCIIKYLNQQLLNVLVTESNSECFKKYFLTSADLIKKMEAPECLQESGFDLIEKVTLLMQLASTLTQKNQNDLVIPQEDKQYFSEITFGTIEGGVRRILRSDSSQRQMPWKGNAGQESARDFCVTQMITMGNYARNESIDVSDEIKIASKALVTEIGKAKKVFDELLLPTRDIEHQFTITASGNIFFTSEIKQAVSNYDAKLVEMENQILIYMLNSLLRRPEAGISLNKTFITKMAADPYKIDESTTEALKQWSRGATMSLDDYMDAYSWTIKGSSFEDVPDSASWAAVKGLSPEVLEREFITYQANNSKSVMNPFWKEIGTDLLNEIREPDRSKDAFSGTIWDGWKSVDDDSLTVDQKKRCIDNLKELAARIFIDRRVLTQLQMEGPVLRLFERYLSLPPMSSINGEKLDKGLFRVYARVGVCKEGVASPLEDYDPLLYKANNTTMLAMQVSQFMPRVGREVANRRQAQPVGMLRQSGLNTQSSASISEGIVQQLADELLLKFMQEQKNLGMSDVDASLDVNDDDDDDDDDSSSDLNDDDISSSDLNACLQEQLDNLLDQINKIKEKSQELTDKRDLPAAIAATELFSTLSKIVLVEPPIVENNEIKGLDNFKSKCHAAIAKARPALTRGWSQILGNVALAIGLVGLLYVAAGLIHMAKTGDFLFFKTKSEKDSQQKLNQIEKTIDEGFDEGFKERIRAN